MSALLTKHAQRRIRQRGRRESEIDFVFSHGTLCKDGVLLTNKDRDRLINEYRCKIRLAEKLAGMFIACEGETVMTVFRADKDQQHRMLSEK
jgi:hypothetical protein